LRAALRGVTEALLLGLVCLAPWAFGAVHPLAELVLYAGVALLLVLWGLGTLLDGTLTWQKCPVTLCLAGLVVSGVLQVLPLPHDVLAWVSPGTAQMYDDFLPRQQETLPFDEPRAAAPSAPGSTISLYPAGTRAEVIRLLAVFLVFAVARNTITTAASLRRLSVALVLNGTLLAFVALLQFFSSPRHMLYWSVPSQGQVFGPFICRNHFPFYVNVCIGLGLGLLLAFRAEGRQWGPREAANGPRGDSPSALGFLQDTRVLGLVCCLALMAGSVVLSLSRGGMVALLGGLLLYGFVKVKEGTGRIAAAAGVVLTVGLAAVLVGWFGLGLVEARLATLWQGDALKDDRLPVWSQSLRSVADFGVWGTGYGTFPYIELLHRQPGQDPLLMYDHAHNDYVEALVEGGGVRLLLSLLAIGLVFACGYRAYRANQGKPSAALVLGGMVGFTTVIIHSFVDFGLHVPAIALLVTVLSAYLCRLGQARRGAAQYSLRLGGAAAVLALVGAVLVGAGLVREGWRAHRAERFRLAARYLTLTGAPGQERRVLACLEGAVRAAPENALLQVELAEAHYHLFLTEVQALDEAGRVHRFLRWTTCTAPVLQGVALHAAVLGATSWKFPTAANEQSGSALQAAWGRKHLVPALRHYLLARDLCPLLDKPHVRLAANVDRLARAEPRQAYLDRAKRLLTADPDLWYICGLQELLDGRREQAWGSWRRSLECSAANLPAILHQAAVYLTPAELVARVLPDRPLMLLAAATDPVVAADAPQRSRPFLERALTLLETQSALTAEDCHARARVLALLDQPDRAVAAYLEALDRRPSAHVWRYELADLLRRQGRLVEARRELRTLVAEHPGYAEAQALYRDVLRALAAGE
jgi:O-antigen ligase/tetratricopeptide (TPR) repeat protein